MTTDDPRDERFDQALRTLHAHALSQLSAGTTAQLHRRRQAALSAAPARRRFGWPLPAAAFASLLVVAAGLGFGLRTVGDAPTTATAAPIAAVDAADSIEGVLADLDQNPDFYAWLASGDADLLAME